MTKNSKLGLVVGTKEYSYWKQIVDNLKIEVENMEKGLKYAKFCLTNATAKLQRCPKPIKA